ncbi:MAG: AraC family transcriptional regulator [Clostridia bacterium]|nr:AraC family transcriptional regulator [Clostridia bacterium]
MKRIAFSPHEGIYIQNLKTSQKNNMPVQHYHDAYEIYLQLDGKRYLFYDNIHYTLERGDMVILKPFDIHYAESREVDYYERYVLNFQPDVLRKILTDEEVYFLLEEKIHPCVVHLSPSDTEDLSEFFRRTESYTKQKGFLTEKLLCTSVLQLIMKSITYIDESMNVTTNHLEPQIIAALSFIYKHYKENISLDEISDAAHMSKYYFCRKFHEVTGTTAFEYLNGIRLSKAHNLLINTNITIDEIASRVGFVSTVNLTRAFKKVYGIAPRDFRKLKKKY